MTTHIFLGFSTALLYIHTPVVDKHAKCTKHTIILLWFVLLSRVSHYHRILAFHNCYIIARFILDSLTISILVFMVSSEEYKTTCKITWSHSPNVDFEIDIKVTYNRVTYCTRNPYCHEVVHYEWGSSHFTTSLHSGFKAVSNTW